MTKETKQYDCHRVIVLLYGGGGVGGEVASISDFRKKSPRFQSVSIRV